MLSSNENKFTISLANNDKTAHSDSSISGVGFRPLHQFSLLKIKKIVSVGDYSTLTSNHSRKKGIDYFV